MKLVAKAGLAILLLAAIAAVAVWTCPADLAWRWFGGRFAPLTLHGLSGSVWQGHADDAELFGQSLGALDWSVAKAPLLRGDAVAAFVLHGAEVTATGSAILRAGGRVEFDDAAVTIPARLAAPVFAVPALQPLGTIEIDLAHAHVVGAWLDEVTGHARWRDAAVSGAAQAAIGDLQATFASSDTGAIGGTITDSGGPLQVNGTFTTSLGRYAAQVRLAPRGDNPQLAEALQYVGQPQADGSRELLIEGRQLQWF